MLHILLMILKIIGIILLCILGLLLVIILCVLFVPIRYKGKAKINDEVVAKANISWLLHIVSIQILYKEEINFILKIFGIPFYNLKKKLERENKKNTNKKKENKKNANKKKPNTESRNEKLRKLNQEKVKEQEEHYQDKTVSEPIEEINEKIELQEDNSETTKSFFGKIKLFIKKIFSVIKGIFVKIRNIKYTIKKICDKMKNIRDLISYYINLMEQEESKEALALCKQQLFRFLNHVKPKKLKAHVTFGTGDPGTTGQILSYASMFYPIYGKNVSLIPDFMNEIFQGDLYMKGRIRLFTIVRIGWKVMFNKNLKKFIKLLKREAI